jgi:hypothetical protein
MECSDSLASHWHPRKASKTPSLNDIQTDQAYVTFLYATLPLSRLSFLLKLNQNNCIFIPFTKKKEVKKMKDTV